MILGKDTWLLQAPLLAAAWGAVAELTVLMGSLWSDWPIWPWPIGPWFWAPYYGGTEVLLLLTGPANRLEVSGQKLVLRTVWLLVVPVAGRGSKPFGDVIAG